MKYRTEFDSLGKIKVPGDKYWGASTQRSNMSKLGEDGKPIYNEHGKVMKGPKYFQPDLGKFIK